MRNILYIVAALVFMGCTWNADNAKPTKSVPVGLENDTTIAAVDSAATVDTDTVRYENFQAGIPTIFIVG